MTPPLITCICPTANRRAFLKRAIDLFLAQDYPAKRLVIVEDGDEHNVDLCPPHAPIHFHRPARGRLTIGEKRNIAIDLAPDGLIAHWDDDDWSASTRLSVQIAAMQRAKARLCGMDRVVFYDGTQTWLYRSDAAVDLIGGTLVYERSLWAEQPFEHRSNGEDTLFVRQAAARDVPRVAMADERYYVARVHAGNTAPKSPDRQWAGYDVRRVRRWIGEAVTEAAHA